MIPTPPIEPMLAKLVDSIPEGDGFLFEPKWDGFRAIVFRTKDDVYIQSRDLRPLDRYFPELHDALIERLPPQCVSMAKSSSRHQTAWISMRCNCVCIRRPHASPSWRRRHLIVRRVRRARQPRPSLMDRPQSERRARWNACSRRSDHLCT